jgi:hypothetical protein
MKKMSLDRLKSPVATKFSVTLLEYRMSGNPMLTNIISKLDYL